MATIRKRGSTYQIDYIDPTGKRIRKTFKKKKDAEAELGKRVSLIAEKRYLDVKKEYTTTLKELLAKYEENFKDQASWQWKKVCIGRFKEYFGENRLISNIRYVDLETYRNDLKQRRVQGQKRKDGKITEGRIRTVASVNREIACLHHIFVKGVQWELIEQSPFDRGKSLLQKENNTRLRFLDEEEIARLIEACPVHLRNIVICALNTGMRRGEILSLKWAQIRNGFIYLEKTKTNESRQIPVNDTLAELFKSIRKRQQLRSNYVFTFVNCGGAMKDPVKNAKCVKLLEDEGMPVNEVKNAFRTALKRAGIENFRFHDLRHTFASQMILKGASLKVVQEILGHKNISMTMRYAHLSQEHKREAISLLNTLTTPFSCHKMSQNAILAQKKDSLQEVSP